MSSEYAHVESWIEKKKADDERQRLAAASAASGLGGPPPSAAGKGGSGEGAASKGKGEGSSPPKFVPRFPAPGPLPGSQAANQQSDAPKQGGEKILLRVKRRRDDEPLEAFVVESQAKRPSLRSAMSSLNVGGGAAGKSSRAASKLFKLLGSVPVAEDEAEERAASLATSAQADSSNSAADETTATTTGGKPAAADVANQTAHHHQHQHHGTGAGTGGNNAKKADENRLEGGASVRRKEAISKVVSSAKAARNSAVEFRRFGLGGERARVVDVDVAKRKTGDGSAREAASGKAGGGGGLPGACKSKAEVFDECEEEGETGGAVSDRLSRVEAAGAGGGAMGGSTAVMCNGVPMSSSRSALPGEDEYIYDYYWVDPSSQLEMLKGAGGDYHGYARVEVDAPELWEELEEDEWGSDEGAQSDDSNDEGHHACDYPEDEESEDEDDSDLGSDGDLYDTRAERQRLREEGGGGVYTGYESGDDEIETYDNEFRFAGGGGGGGKKDCNYYAYDSEEEMSDY